MLGWFQRLLPKTGDFFGMFEAHSAMLVAAAEALKQLASDGGSTEKCLRTIQDREHVADDVIREGCERHIRKIQVRSAWSGRKGFFGIQHLDQLVEFDAAFRASFRERYVPAAAIVDPDARGRFRRTADSRRSHKIV